MVFFAIQTRGSYKGSSGYMVTCCHLVPVQSTPHISRHVRHHHEANDQSCLMLCVLRRQAISIVHYREDDDIQSSQSDLVLPRTR